MSEHMAQKTAAPADDKRLQADDKTYSSPMELTLEVVGGKWKSLLVYHLLDAPLRFSELRRQVPGITEKMLTQQLRELERDGIVSRTVFPEVPPRVEYVATEHGRTLKPVLEAMCHWGRHHWQQRTA